MARLPRFAPAGCVLHVVTRSIEDQHLFYDPEEFRSLEQILAEGLVLHDVALFEYCLMPNHLHLACSPRRPGALSDLMKFVKQKFAHLWRRRRSTTGRGHVFQGRFASHPVQTQHYLYNVFAYIGRNAIRAGLVRSAVDWEWSSVSRRFHGDPIASQLLSAWPEPMPTAWERIVDERILADDEARIRECIRTGTPYGDPDWAERLQRQAS